MKLVAELGSTWELLMMGVISLYSFPLWAFVGCVVFLLCPSLECSSSKAMLLVLPGIATLPASVQQRTETRQG